MATEQKLKRVLGMPTLVAIIIGIAISQVALVSLLQAIGYGGGASQVTIIGTYAVAFALALTYVATFAELALMMPSAGGLSAYTEVALGHFPALVATFAGYVVVNMFGLPAELLVIDNVMHEVLGFNIPTNVIALGILASLTLLNILGTDIFALLQNLTTGMKVLAVLGTGLAALLLAPALPVAVPAVQGGVQVAAAAASADTSGLLALFIWCFVGAEFACPMIEETVDAERNIPRSMVVALALVAVLFGLYGLGATRVLSQDTMLSSRFPHLDYANAVFGRAGAIFLALTAAAATLGLVNAVLGGVSRMLYGMAKNGQAFPFLGKLHPKFGTPWAAILFMSGISAIPLLALGNQPETVTILVVSASTSWLLAYIVAHVDLIVLRRRYPDLARPFRSPLFPLVQIVGIAGMGFAAINNSPSPDLAQTVHLIAGCVLGIVGIASAIWVRFFMKKRLFEAEPIPAPLSTAVPEPADRPALNDAAGI